ncbi:hypothetical protein IFM89_002074 [Coptis chinensis]|uniref:Uncharacterized protein n=1 Tax=Coptis chinensis TaxID=261450 RepID=A0A835H146_9MAGN|nr:hypothetical protein IFM89_002074 [Coptis chinensis]
MPSVFIFWSSLVMVFTGRAILFALAQFLIKVIGFLFSPVDLILIHLIDQGRGIPVEWSPKHETVLASSGSCEVDDLGPRPGGGKRLIVSGVEQRKTRLGEKGKRCGRVYFRVGNVYVQFREKEHAAKALRNLTRRYHAGYFHRHFQH